MNGLPYYKRYPRDFLDGTAGWPLDLKGAYSTILDLIYLHGGRLVDEPRFIAGHLGCSVRAWNLYRATLIEKGKLQVIGGLLSNYVADKHLESLGIFQEKQRENAAKPRKTKRLDKTMAKPKDSHTDTDTDTDIEPKGSIVRAPKLDPILAILTEGWGGPRPLASPDAAQSYITYRKVNKMPMTERAARMVAKELRALFDSGGDCDEALDMAQLKTWRGFRADWYFNAKGLNHGNGNQTLSGSGAGGTGPSMGDALVWAAQRKAAQRDRSAGSSDGFI